MPLLGSAEQEWVYNSLQDADHRAACQRRDEDNAETLDPEMEELFRYFDTPEPRLPAPEEEAAASRLARRMERLAAAGVENDPRNWT